MSDYTVLDVVGIDVAPNGAVRLRVGDAFNEEGYSADTPVYGLANVVSVPLPPENGEAAQALCIEGGNRRRAIAMRDNRIAAQGGTLSPGDTAIFTDGEAKLLVKRDTDQVIAYTKGATSGDSQMIINDGENDQIVLTVGATFISIGREEIVLAVNGGASITLNKQSIAMLTNAIQAVAASVQLGDMGGGVPVPPTPATAVAIAPGGPVNVVSSKVFAAP
jgi:phage gp45-like